MDFPGGCVCVFVAKLGNTQHIEYRFNKMTASQNIFHDSD